MSKRVLISLMLIGILAFSAAFGTFAYLSTDLVNKGNTFSTGNLTLGLLDKNGQVSTSSVISIDKMLPSDDTYGSLTAEKKTITIKNTGDYALTFNMKADSINEWDQVINDTNPIFKYLRVKILLAKIGPLEKWSDPVYLKDFDLGKYGVYLDKGSNIPLTFKIWLAGDATEQGASANVRFTFNAKQFPMPGVQPKGAVDGAAFLLDSEPVVDTEAVPAAE